jgi:glycosyltransferase involved in cell wall biosynthesis
MAKKIKLCIITPTHWTDNMGGSEYQVKLLAENILKHDNAHLTYIARKIKNGYSPQKYDLVKISKENMFQRYALFIDAFNLLKVLKEIKPNIIYQRVGGAYTGISAFYAKKAGCKMIWHIANDTDLFYEHKWSGIKPNILIDKTIFQWGIKNSQVIIAQSEYQKMIVEKMNRKASVHLIRNFHPLPEKNSIIDKTDQIIWIANIKKAKQPEIYIELAKKLKKKEIRTECIMVGAPTCYPKDYQKGLDEGINKLDNLKYLGKLPQNKVNNLISQSKLLINTSMWEGFPNTFIQAWMRKTPVVSLHCDPDHVIRNYECGMVSGTLEKMFEDVAFLLNNEQKRKIMGDNAQRYAFENHSMKNLDKLKKIILENHWTI